MGFEHLPNLLEIAHEDHSANNELAGNRRNNFIYNKTSSK